MTWVLVVLGVMVAIWPWRFSLLVRWGDEAAWSLSFWSWCVANGRLRDIAKPKLFRKGTPAKTPPKKKKGGRPFSLRRFALKMWQDRHDLVGLVRFSNRSTGRILNALSRRFTIVLGGLDPVDQGWLSVFESVRQGSGWLRKVKVLNDWSPDARGGAVRWDIGFCALEIAWCCLVILLDVPWKIAYRLWREPKAPRLNPDPPTQA
ncbi:MAG: hypothetical protein RL318_1572 [Fibrobacterota bacterium]|jgi:hypothetical protein